ncbi:hypothetical protein CONPUDRAFT_77729 [Coniophora puteana RWD-64-598 SS2]|uniref:Uncharacterized protein n=1 Tax=Coniophora puteana (strain RWD-64-598) TaxID=741705 RepID=A0A5M3M6H7_CONPW|nr:uncharacterized protein CONPUDRAFT_77729 [Coniophora puteana RWD-64-598 SS2]EIW74938.1 hypothetical protein CONPUDRAFT_77729 [Coniophora puteana RWD-64-598 SS2]
MPATWLDPLSPYLGTIHSGSWTYRRSAFYLGLTLAMVKLWNTKLKLPKLLFFFYRYFSLLVCSVWVFKIISWLCAEDRFVVAPVTAMFFACGGCFIGGAIADLPLSHVLQPELGMCIINELSLTPYLTSVPVMSMDFVLVLLIGGKSIAYQMNVPNKKWMGANLMKTLAQRAFLCYLCIFLATLLQLVLFLTNPVFLSISAGIMFTLLPIAINRLVLGLHQMSASDLASSGAASKHFGV